MEKSSKLLIGHSDFIEILILYSLSKQLILCTLNMTDTIFLKVLIMLSKNELFLKGKEWPKCVDDGFYSVVALIMFF